MSRLAPFDRLAFKLASFIAVACLALLFLSATHAADETPASRPTHYHADPEHLWNRLHEALFVRGAFGQDRLEPLLWTSSKHLLEERSHTRAMAVLEEFLKNDGEKLIDDPLKRAVLQRDLWMVFNWLELGEFDFAEPRLSQKEAGAARERLRVPLAEVIARLALTPQQITELPDNYSAAVASGQFAKTHLPPDLFAADGPWVSVGRTDRQTAPQHLRGENPFSNSVFLIFIRLPVASTEAGEIGRQARMDVASYLKDRPVLPIGTELALVRRAMLIDTSHQVVPSNLNESVQLRVLHGSRASEAAFEFRLSRSQLFANRAGGLRASGQDDRDFKTGFLSKTWDEIEDSESQGRLPGDRMQPMLRCSVCHAARHPEFLSGGTKDRPNPMAVMSVSDVSAAAIKWRVAHPTWVRLKRLLKN
jgi:hypothetical protein